MKENIPENNRLIAEFMGGELREDKHEPKDSFYVFVDPPKGRTGEMISDLQYHTSWDWLMPVVIKIWSITGHRSLFYFDLPVKDDTEKVDTIFATHLNDKEPLLQVYSAVVEFIKWYNNQKKS